MELTIHIETAGTFPVLPRRVVKASMYSKKLISKSGCLPNIRMNIKSFLGSR